MMKSAWDLVAMAAHRTPRQLALVDDRSERRLTYAELVDEVESIAAGLAARGVRTAARGSRPCCRTSSTTAWSRWRSTVSARWSRSSTSGSSRRTSRALVERTRIAGAVILPDADLAARLRGVLPDGAPLLAAGGAAGPARGSRRLPRARASRRPPTRRSIPKRRR